MISLFFNSLKNIDKNFDWAHAQTRKSIFILFYWMCAIITCDVYSNYEIIQIFSFDCLATKSNCSCFPVFGFAPLHPILSLSFLSWKLNECVCNTIIYENNNNNKQIKKLFVHLFVFPSFPFLFPIVFYFSLQKYHISIEIRNSIFF